MPRVNAPIFPHERRQLAGLGERLRDARRRRRFTAEETAARVGITAVTLRRLERGEPGVGVGTLARLLTVLSLGSDVDRIAIDDALGRRLDEARLPERARRPNSGRAK